MSDKTKNIAKLAFVILICRLFSKILGFARDFMTASTFGTTMQADCYNIASIIPNMLFALIGSAIVTTFIPIYNEVLHKKGKKEAIGFSNNVINIFVIACLFFTVISEILGERLVSIIAPTFYGERLILTTNLTRIFLTTIVLNTLVYIFTAMLQAEHKFTIPELIGLPFNLIMIIFLIFYSKEYGIVGLTIVNAIAILLQVLFQVPSIIKTKFKYRFKIDLNDENLRQMSVKILPILIGTGVQQINSLFNGIFTSSLKVGSMSSLTYASKIYVLVCEIFIYSFITAIYPSLTRMVSKENLDLLKRTINYSINILSIVVIPITTFILIFNVEIVRLFFERGAFDSNATLMTSHALFYYALGIEGIAIMQVFCRAFYSLKDTKTPMIIGVFSVFVDVIFSYVLRKFLDVGGIALATGISSYFSCFLLYISLRNKIDYKEISQIKDTVVKVIISSIVMGIVSKNIYSYIDTVYIKSDFLGQFTKLSISIFIGSIIYISLGYVLKIEDIKKLISILKAKIKVFSISKLGEI